MNISCARGQSHLLSQTGWTLESLAILCVKVKSSGTLHKVEKAGSIHDQKQIHISPWLIEVWYELRCKNRLKKLPGSLVGELYLLRCQRQNVVKLNFCVMCVQVLEEHSIEALRLRFMTSFLNIKRDSFGLVNLVRVTSLSPQTASFSCLPYCIPK